MKLFENRKFKKLMADWEKGGLSANKFADELGKLNGYNWDDVEAFQNKDKPVSDGSVDGARGGGGWLALIELILAGIALLSLVGLGMWARGQLAEQGEQLAQLQNTARAARQSQQAFNQMSARVSALETAVIPALVIVQSIEAEAFPQRVYVGSEPIEIKFRVSGDGVEGEIIDFEVNPDNLAGLVTPHSGVVVSGVATVILQPDEVGTVTITPRFRDQQFDTYTISIVPRPSLSHQIEPQQTVAGRPTIFSITVTNNGATQVPDSTLICQKPSSVHITNLYDFQIDGKEIRTLIGAMDMGKGVSKQIAFRSNEPFDLSCRIEDDRSDVLGEANMRVVVTAPSPSRISIMPKMLDVGVNANAIITATATDQSGSPLSDIPIKWTISNKTLGKLSAAKSVPTDVSGSARVILTTSAVGKGILTASVANSQISIFLSITIRPVATAKQTGATLRMGPGTEYPEIRKTTQSERLIIVGRNGDWWQVRNSAGQSAWIFKDKVSVKGDTSNTPTIPPSSQRWSIISSNGSGKVKLFDSNQREIGELPVRKEVEGVLQDSRMSTEMTLWIEKDFIGNSSQLVNITDDTSICWNVPLHNDNSCGHLTTNAKGLQVMAKAEQGGWISVTFTTWIREEDLKWSGP